MIRMFAIVYASNESKAAPKWIKMWEFAQERFRTVPTMFDLGHRRAELQRAIFDILDITLNALLGLHQWEAADMRCEYLRMKVKHLF